MGGTLNSLPRNAPRVIRPEGSGEAESHVRCSRDCERGRPQLRTLSQKLLVVLLGIFCSAALGAVLSPADQFAEREHWRKERERRAAEQRAYFRAREEAKEIVAELKQEGAVIQPELILAEDGPSVEEPPSWLKTRRDQVFLGLAGSLLVLLSAITLVRHQREAEIRKLSGGYLSDGTEVAKFKMPDWFAPAPEIKPEDLKPRAESETAAVDDQAAATAARLAEAVAQFYKDTPDALTCIRAVLKELAGTEEPVARQQVLLQLHVLVHDVAKRANCWELRPAWQLSSALELLIKRIADNPKDVTPSALRTVSTGIDLLHELCVPGVRSNLVIEPPVRVLAIDDEKLCLRAISYALDKARIPVDVATYGAQGLMLATEKPYDAIFLDIEMPDMDGLATCANIRRTQLNADTPIVFVTIHNDFSMRARTIAIGGSDFMAKPFLVFELTVKAMTLLMRKRLDVAKPNRVALQPQPAPAADGIPVIEKDELLAAIPSAPVAVAATVAAQTSEPAAKKAFEVKKDTELRPAPPRTTTGQSRAISCAHGGTRHKKVKVEDFVTNIVRTTDIPIDDLDQLQGYLRGSMPDAPDALSVVRPVGANYVEMRTADGERLLARYSLAKA
jgi:CheY-like chemotaxis protein